MNYKFIYSIVVFLMLFGCAAQEEPVSSRESKSLILQDDYEDLQVKPIKEEPVIVDYKEGTFRRNIETIKKLSTEEANQLKFIDVASSGSEGELKKYYEKGANVNFRNVDGETALINVLDGPYNEMTLDKLKYLLLIGAEVNFRGKSEKSDNTTPLGVAVWNSAIIFHSGNAPQYPIAKQVLKILIAAGANIPGLDAGGRTPLHTAAKTNNLFAAELILASGAELNSEDANGKTPLDFAEAGEMIMFLKERGAQAGIPRQNLEPIKVNITEKDLHQRVDFDKKAPKITDPDQLNPYK